MQTARVHRRYRAWRNGMKNRSAAFIAALLVGAISMSYAHGGLGQEGSNNQRHPVFNEATDQTVINPANVDWQPLELEGFEPGAEFTMLRGELEDEQGSELLIRLPPGYEVPVHSHTSDEVYVWLEGAFDLVDSDGARTEFAGPAYINLPGNAPPHGLVCGSEQACLLYVNYSRPFDVLYPSQQGAAEEQE
jgi:quercetin dioxygenase-like cupin family protein